MILFWDKNIGKVIPRVLRNLKLQGHVIRYYSEVFVGSDDQKENGDDFWLRTVGESDWIVFTQDYNYHTKPTELFAIRQYKIGCFYLWGASASRWEQMRSFARAYDRIIDAAISTPKPFIYRTTRSGQLKQLL